MLNMRKNVVNDIANVAVLGAGAAWKTSGGGQKGLLGRLRRAVGTDLDLAAVALSDGHPKRICWFDNQDSFDDGTLISYGDSRTGKADGDDEFIKADLNNLPESIDAVVFIVSAFKEGVSFNNIEGVTMNLYDMSAGGNRKIGEFMPDIDSRNNAAVLAVAKRTEFTWTIQAINEMGNARSRQALLDLAKRYA
jgi:stress response protein SCP2